MRLIDLFQIIDMYDHVRIEFGDDIYYEMPFRFVKAHADLCKRKIIWMSSCFHNGSPTLRIKLTTSGRKRKHQ